MSERRVYYFNFFYQRILTSCKGWKDDEFGAYVKLLIHQFDTGFIPDDPDELERIITTYKKNWARLAKKFKPGTNPGELINQFMDEVRDKALKKLEKNGENGRLGGRPKNNPTVNRNETEPKPNGYEKKSQSNGYLVSGSNSENIEYGRVQNQFFGDVPDDLINLSRSLQPTEKADQWHDYVQQKIEDLGYKTFREVAVVYGDGENGRLDLVVEKHGLKTAIELDYRTPRKKSILKVKTYSNGMVLLRDPKIIRTNSMPPEQPVVQGMWDIWRGINPGYPGALETDFNALFDIGEFIAAQLQSNWLPETDIGRLAILEMWNRLAKWISADNFYKDWSLGTISTVKNLQTIWQKSKTPKDGKATPAAGSGNRRQVGNNELIDSIQGDLRAIAAGANDGGSEV